MSKPRYEVRTVHYTHYQVVLGVKRILGNIPSLKDANWLSDQLNLVEQLPIVKKVFDELISDQCATIREHEETIRTLELKNLDLKETIREMPEIPHAG